MISDYAYKVLPEVLLLHMQNMLFCQTYALYKFAQAAHG